MPKQTNSVDKNRFPCSPFGVIHKWVKWETVAQNLMDNKVDFFIELYICFTGQTGEQATIAFNDPRGNAIEIKAFRNQNDSFNVRDREVPEI